MKLTDKIVSKYGTDKALHFAFGGWIASYFCPFGTMYTCAGILVVLILAIIKDKFFDSSYDKKDVVASLCGAIAASVVGTIIQLLLW